MILEGLVTTINPDATVNVSPMGPSVDAGMSRFELRPYQTSRTFENLVRTRQGVFHVSDDVELLARAAVDRLDQPPPLVPADGFEGWVLADACRWYAFRICEIDNREPRAKLSADVVRRGRLRDFFGFNRAKHAVVEAAILATRLDFLPPQEILDEFRRLAVPVQKTGGDQERRAFKFLEHYVHADLTRRSSFVSGEQLVGGGRPDRRLDAKPDLAGGTPAPHETSDPHPTPARGPLRI